MNRGFATWALLLIVAAVALGGTYLYAMHPATVATTTIRSNHASSTTSVAIPASVSAQNLRITSINPNWGSPTDTITLSGSNFSGDSVVIIASTTFDAGPNGYFESGKYRGAKLPATTLSSTSLSFVIPSDISIDGYFPIHVENKVGDFKSNVVPLCILGDPRGGLFDNCPPIIDDKSVPSGNVGSHTLSGFPGGSVELSGENTFLPKGNMAIVSKNGSIVSKIATGDPRLEEYYQKVFFQLPKNIAPGEYTLQIENAAGISNAVPLTVSAQ